MAVHGHFRHRGSIGDGLHRGRRDPSLNEEGARGFQHRPALCYIPGPAAAAPGNTGREILIAEIHGLCRPDIIDGRASCKKIDEFSLVRLLYL
jgi:hypothetical protein